MSGRHSERVIQHRVYDRTLDGPAKPHDQVQHSKSSAAFLYLIMTDQAAPAATALLRANSRSLAAPRTALARNLAILGALIGVRLAARAAGLRFLHARFLIIGTVSP